MAIFSFGGRLVVKCCFISTGDLDMGISQVNACITAKDSLQLEKSYIIMRF